MRKIQLHPSILCYYVRELINSRSSKTGAWYLGNHPVACVMLAKDLNGKWHRGMAIEPVGSSKPGEHFNYDAYRALAYKRLTKAGRSQGSTQMVQQKLPTMRRFFSCTNTDKVKMAFMSEAGCKLTDFELHIVEVMKPDTVTLSVVVN